MKNLFYTRPVLHGKRCNMILSSRTATSVITSIERKRDIDIDVDRKKKEKEREREKKNIYTYNYNQVEWENYELELYISATVFYLFFKMNFYSKHKRISHANRG